MVVKTPSQTAPEKQQQRRPLVGRGTMLSLLALLAVAAVVIALVVRRRDEGIRRDLQVLEGVRKVCKLATVELSLADYSRRTLPKKVDLPFTAPSEAFLFYAGVVSAGFDVCDQPFRIKIDHAARTVAVSLPPPRILSLDIKRFEIINERSALLNAIEPADRNQWYQDARASLDEGALRSGVLTKAEAHARELFESFVGSWGYRLTLTLQAPTLAPAAPSR